MRTVFSSLRNDGAGAVRDALDRWRFRARRIDYFDYLAVLLAGMDGARTLKDVFLGDARRYGESSLRGRVSAWWVDIYQRAGGDLYATWQAHVPRSELVLIRAAQLQGNEALVQTLAELVEALRLLQESMRVLYATLWPAVLALGLATAVTLAVPWLTLPRLLDAFASVPVDYYGTITRRLVGFAALVDSLWIFIMAGVVMSVWSVIAWLPKRPGRLRRRLDQWLWWDIYRNVCALRFLAFLRISLGHDRTGATRLRSALLHVRNGAQPWLAAHIDDMLDRLARGDSGPQVFDTGLFSREQFWFLSDMVLTRGLVTGLALAQGRIRAQIVGAVAIQAAVMRWVMLLACVTYVLGLLLWHYAVIDDLRRSLTFWLAS